MKWLWSRRVIAATSTVVDDFGVQLRELAQELLTIEVNTIMKDNMVAGPMPTIPNALIDIANTYLDAFRDLRLDVTAIYVAAAGAPSPDWSGVHVVRCPPEQALTCFDIRDREVRFDHLFETLRRAAARTAAEYRTVLREQDGILLRRIEDNSDRIAGILSGKDFAAKTVRVHDIQSRIDVFLPPPDLSARERLAIKKIWDLGAERVIAQTVLQLDGDIITRIAREYERLAGGREQAVQLFALHHQALDTAVSRWDSLIRAASDVVGGLTGRPR